MSTRYIGYTRNEHAGQFKGRTLDKVFADDEKPFGPAWAELIQYVRAGDCVVVPSVDRITRSVGQFRGVVDNLRALGVTVEEA